MRRLPYRTTVAAGAGDKMTYFFAIGALLGLSSGLAPGPLLTLVITETLQHGVKAGIKVALAPLITDLPIIALTLLLLARLASFNNIMGIIALAGGCLLLGMGFSSLRARGLAMDPGQDQAGSLLKGVLANVLNPHPYLFWAGVGAPVMAEAWRAHPGALPAFILGFYGCLVGSKILLAVITGKSKHFLSGKAYIYTMRGLGLALCALALALFHEGLKLLGIAS